MIFRHKQYFQAFPAAFNMAHLVDGDVYVFRPHVCVDNFLVAVYRPLPYLENGPSYVYDAHG